MSLGTLSQLNNVKSRMTAIIFENWLLYLDKQKKYKYKKIVLIIDNCTAYLQINDFKHVTMVYFLPNAMSIRQPLNHQTQL